ncbi:MAG: cyclopropane fatty acyl phospholipid synthase [Candidatus Yonathbacteria bacterium]|nr:cyclopropane fatty acyl phospholipid synthase [Candidatus Yonathbacteria bacterium]NTW47686.1 cyclopropane fatty acyl phospholipid synthase [Candidatus Yonathbacteria bacterium]
MRQKENGFVSELLYSVGVTINAPNGSGLQVRDERFYSEIVRRGSLGLGEAYMDGLWDHDDLSDFFCRVIGGGLEKEAKSLKTVIALGPEILSSVLADCGHWKNSHRVGEHHYDVGNDLYRLMLGKHMVYSCAYWKDAQNLNEAQEHKMRLICEKLGLKEGMTLLDIGCGFGELLAFAAKHYDIRGVGITISKEQAKLAETLFREYDVSDRVSIKVQDYRHQLGVKFDRVVSVGMFEHVGPKYYQTYFDTVRAYLKKDGLFLLHTIAGHESYRTTEPWVHKYIFPGGVLPSYEQVTKAFQRAEFVMEDWHNFGADYDNTLMAWYQNLLPRWDTLIATGKYDERFRRMWEYYLLSFAGAFRSRNLDLWQIVFSPKGVKGGYTSVR